MNRSASWVIPVCTLATITGCKVSDKSVTSQADDTHKALSPAIIDDPQINAYLQSIGDRIIEVAKKEDAQHVGPKTHFVKHEENKWMFTSEIKFQWELEPQTNTDEHR